MTHLGKSPLHVQEASLALLSTSMFISSTLPKNDSIKEKIAVDKTFGLKNKNKSKACALLPARHVEHDVTTIC